MDQPKDDTAVEQSPLLATLARLVASGSFSAEQQQLLHDLTVQATRCVDQQRVAAERIRQLEATLGRQRLPLPAVPLLEDAETRFREFVDAAPDSVVAIDHQGLIVLVNRQTELVFGYQREELIGQPLEMLVPERLRRSHVAHRTAYAAAPHTRPMGVGLQLYGRCRDGREIPVEISLSPLPAPDGLMVTAVIRDVTEQRRAARQLQQTAALLARQTAELARSNQELEQFAYIASHDLQEPLRMVASYTQLLARRYQGRLDADADEFIGYAVDGANRMHRLIQDLLAYSRVGTRGHPFVAVDCGRLVDAVVADLQPLLQEAGATITHETLPVVHGDQTQLRQLWQNLLENALKYRQPALPPQVVIAATTEGEWWHFTVQDNGIGIAPEFAERIFVIFQRLHTQDEYPGTGIGLAICKKILERHGGRIWVESAVGTGATFHFTLPAAPPEQEGVGNVQPGTTPATAS